MKRLVAVLLACLIGFICFVWPTKYRRSEMKLGEGVTLQIRENRFTGATERLTVKGWLPNEPDLPPVGPAVAVLPPPQPMPKVAVDCYDAKGNLVPDQFAKYGGITMACAPGQTAVPTAGARTLGKVSALNASANFGEGKMLPNVES
ncbi:MAG: hypothetical protein WB985_12260 [Candidatus Acidiferrales bacterium]